MSLRFKGGVISSIAPTTSGTPYTGLAKGVWSLEDQIQAKAAGLWPRAIGTPEAPTIGTVTAGNTLVTVAYTAPADNGGSTITSYTATSSPGNISATGTTSPITVTGLTNDTTYTFTVVANNAYGIGIPSAASSPVTPVSVPTIIGQAFGGGFYAGLISTTGNSTATHYLIVGPKASAQSSTVLQYKTTNTDTAGTYSVIEGPTNSSNMNNASHPAAYFCEGLTIGGYSDWYLPSKNELEVCYYNLKPTSAVNTLELNSGVNGNSVPARGTSYTTGTPALTSAVDFVSPAAQSFGGTDYYWSSTADSATQAWAQYFGNGIQFADNKTLGNAVFARAIRRVAI